MQILIRALGAALALCVAIHPARAEWREASTKHFLVYSEGSPQQLRQAASDLEKYFFMLRFVTGARDQAAPIKVKVFLLDNMTEVADALPFGGSGIAGFYTANLFGPIAVGTRTSTGGQYGLKAQEVLFHELAHHFMLQNFPAVYPAAYVEGFAEYYSTARIKPDDTIEVGHAVQNRYLAFWANEWLPVSKLLTAKSYDDVHDIQLLYTEGWLLVHYLNNNRERAAQLTTYLKLINSGQSFEQAMNSAFGPGAKALNSELRKYAARRSIMAMVLPFKPINIGRLDIRALSATENSMMPATIALNVGIPQRGAARFAQRMRPAAAQFSRDPYALRILTEAERSAGNNEPAMAAVQRWLEISPADPIALMHKGELMGIALAASGSNDQLAWDNSRKPIIAAIKGAPRNPQPLVAYYKSFEKQGVLPPPGAQNGLAMAFELVPQDDILRYMVAADFERRNMVAEAIATIKPSAFSLHAPESDPKKKNKELAEREKYRIVGDNRQETAAEMLRRLEQKLATTPAK